MTGPDILAALFETTDIPARDALLLEATQLGLFDPIEYSPVESTFGDHTATFLVAQEPLKFAGVRATVNARTQQWIADVLGCTLPTPKILRLQHEQANVKVQPFTRTTQGMSTAAAMLEASTEIDRRLKLALAIASPNPGLRSMYAKSWVLTKLGLAWGDRVPNMGLASPMQPGAPVKWTQLPQQGRENAHNFDHHDYSQLAYLLFADCTVDGTTMRVADVARDPELWPLLCDDGPLDAFRLDLPEQPRTPDELPSPLELDWSAIEAGRILPMHYRPDLLRRPDLVVIHATQGAEAANGAENTMSWFRTGPFPNGPASVHWCVDSDSIVAGAPENVVAFGARGANHDGIHIEICGRSEQGHAGWSDEYSQAALLRAAHVTARALTTWKLPLRWVPASELQASYRGVQGITSHVSVTRGRKESTHTDPGASFPILRFLRMVEQALCLA